MVAVLIDGKLHAAHLRDQVRDAVHSLVAKGVRPGLAVILVGDDAASQVYVRNKVRQTAEAGMRSFEFRLPADTSQQDLEALVDRLNRDQEVDGILVQLPLPGNLDAGPIIARIDPDKDVDGLTDTSTGRLANGRAGLIPCTPLGSMMLLRSVVPRLSGLSAIVLGRSILVGKPMAQLLLAADATVTIAHSRTQNLKALCLQADILVAAVGRPAMVRGDWVKPGAVVIDVGINRVADPQAPGGSRLVGDVAFDEAVAVAGAITPVPGGVGPMTIACLLRNTVQAACTRRDLALPSLG